MDKRTADALEASIAHWQENVAAETPDDASVNGTDCALCRIFFNGSTSDCCSGCPVQVRTGRSYCGGTPYESAADAFDEWFIGVHGARAAWRTAARAELEFLISLRNETSP